MQTSCVSNLRTTWASPFRVAIFRRRSARRRARHQRRKDMYGHVPQASGRARMSGAVTAVALTLATGYGVMVAATRSFVPPVEKITELFIMEPEKLQEVKPLPVEKPKIVVEKPPEFVAPPIVPPPQVQPVIVAPPAPAEPAPAPVSAPVASGND